MIVFNTRFWKFLQSSGWFSEASWECTETVWWFSQVDPTKCRWRMKVWCLSRRELVWVPVQEDKRLLISWKKENDWRGKFSEKEKSSWKKNIQLKDYNIVCGKYGGRRKKYEVIKSSKKNGWQLLFQSVLKMVPREQSTKLHSSHTSALHKMAHFCVSKMKISQKLLIRTWSLYSPIECSYHIHISY